MKLSAILICLCAAISHAQTTQPTSQPATVDSLLSLVPQPTQSQIRDSLTSAHVDPTTLPAVSFVVEGDATAAFNSAKPGAAVYLKPGGSYQSNTANVTGAGARIIGDSITPANIKINKTGMAINAANVEVAGIHASGFAKLLHVNKPGLHIHDCTADSLGYFAVLDAGADGFLVENVSGSKIGGDLFYVVASNGVIRNVTVTSTTSPNSENVIRLERSENNRAVVCTNLLIDRCDLTNNSTSGKAGLAARYYQDLAVSNSTFRPYVRTGQDGTPPAGTALMRATFKDCKFPGGVTLPKGGAIIDVKDGCDVTIDGATFGPFADVKTSCIHVKGTSTLRWRNLTVNGTLNVPIITSDPGAVIVQLP